MTSQVQGTLTVIQPPARAKLNTLQRMMMKFTEYLQPVNQKVQYATKNY